jgi:hypothetical protein
MSDYSGGRVCSCMLLVTLVVSSGLVLLLAYSRGTAEVDRVDASPCNQQKDRVDAACPTRLLIQ